MPCVKWYTPQLPSPSPTSFIAQGPLSKMLQQEKERTSGCGILEGNREGEAHEVRAKTVSPRTVQFLISEIVVRLPGLRSLSRVSLLPRSRCSTACRGAAALDRSPDCRAARTWLVFHSTTGECHSSWHSPSNDLSAVSPVCYTVCPLWYGFSSRKTTSPLLSNQFPNILGCWWLVLQRQRGCTQYYLSSGILSHSQWCDAWVQSGLSAKCTSSQFMPPVFPRE